MIIISDTTPLRYLIEIGQAEILHALFKTVVVPHAVSDELQESRTPQQVREWMQSAPAWLEVRQADTSFFPQIGRLGKGEQEAIALAIELMADVLLIDDRKAMHAAKRQNVKTLGTLSILELAAEKNLLDLPLAISQLSATSFRATPALFQEVLDRDQQCKQAQLNQPE